MTANSLNKIGSREAIGQKIFDLFSLTKPTITLLVAVTVIPSLLLAAGGLPDLGASIAAIVGACLASASAAVFNQVVEVDIDFKMNRTKLRSLASGRLPKELAILFGLSTGILGFLILYIYATPAAALTATCGHLFYVFFYTMYLKRRTEQNIVIGGAAGAVGPLIGWTAITGHLAWPAWSLFLIIFLWTPPHFWALAIKYQEDYAQAGIPMYPVIHGEKKTKRLMLLYTISLLPCIISLYSYEGVGWIYLLCSIAFTSKFIFDAYRLYLTKSNAGVMPFFHFSCSYVFAIFGALTLDCLFQLL